jgi:uncharacterized membrane-anchored protein YjiN (DUF445 family)
MTTPFAARPDDEARQAALDVMKRRATGLLVLAVLVFLAADHYQGTYSWLGYVRATAEASVVGGLADWFAVTALFRHPLNIPIPHTAIIGRQKDRIGRIIGNFVQHHFLSREAVSIKLRGMRIAERVGDWLGDPANAQRIAVQLASGLARTLEALPDEKIRDLIQQGAMDRIRSTRVAPVLGKTLAVVVAGDRHQEILNEAIRIAGRAVRENEDAIRSRVKKEMPWWVPSAIDNRIYQRIITAVDQLLNDISNNPSHPVRGSFDRALRDFVERLQHSPEASARAEALKEEWLSEEAVADLAEWIWTSTRQAVAGYATRTEGTEPGPLARGLADFGRSLRGNPALLAELDEVILGIALDVVEKHRHEAADLIAQTVAGWDPEATSRRLELAVGRDLQFVRINGTIVGGMVGLAIYAVPRLFR